MSNTTKPPIFLRDRLPLFSWVNKATHIAPVKIMEAPPPESGTPSSPKEEMDAAAVRSASVLPVTIDGPLVRYYTVMFSVS